MSCPSLVLAHGDHRPWAPISIETFRSGPVIGRNKPDERHSVVTSCGMHIQLLRADSACIAKLWQEIEGRVGTGGLACSWAWTETWLRHYGDLVPHRFVVGERGEPCAIALLTEGVSITRGPFRIRTLHLGTAGESETETVRVQYNRVLAGRSDRDAFTRGVIDLASASDLQWDEFHLDGFSADEVPALFEPASSFVAHRRVCYVTELAAIRDAGQTVLTALDSHAAKKIRRSIRYVEQAHGPIQVDWAESLEQAREIFDEMVTLHQARWALEGQTGAFASARFAGFHREIVDRLFPLGSVLLSRVRAGDVTLGCDYSFIERNRVLAYQWGLAQLPDKRPSVGLITGVASMQEALRRGIDEYDWLAGDAYYKRQLTTTERELIWACTARGSRIQAIYKLAEAKQLARRLPALLARHQEVGA
jgi:hypothetical protein